MVALSAAHLDTIDSIVCEKMVKVGVCWELILLLLLLGTNNDTGPVLVNLLVMVFVFFIVLTSIRLLLSVPMNIVEARL